MLSASGAIQQDTQSRTRVMNFSANVPTIPMDPLPNLRLCFSVLRMACRLMNFDHDGNVEFHVKLGAL